MAARVTVMDPATQAVYSPEDSTVPIHRSWLGPANYYGEGEFTVLVPKGKVRVLVSHGPEYEVYDRTFNVNGDRRLRITLAPLFPVEDYGWYSGDTHVHIAHGGTGAVYTVTGADLARIGRAEDLNLVCGLSNGLYFAGGADDPAGDPEHVVHFDMEYRSALYGHMGILGLHTLLPFGCCLPGYPAVPLNCDVAALAHDQGATVIFAHPVTMNPVEMGDADLAWPYSGFGRELPVDLLVGRIDAVDVYSYSNYDQTVSRQLWFDLLNLGFHLPLSVGTDASVNRLTDPPPGGFRVYVQPSGAFNYDHWLAGLRAGRSFGTNGPLPVEFTLNGVGIGGTLNTAGGGTDPVDCRLRLFSREPVETLEIYFNGRLTASLALPAFDRELEQGFRIYLPPQSGWVVARLVGKHPGPTDVWSNLEALTSPIYVNHEGDPMPVDPGAVSRFDAWIGDLEQLVLTRGSWENPDQMEQVWNVCESARQRLLKRRPAAGGRIPVPEQESTIRSARPALARVEGPGSPLFRAVGAGEARLEVFDVAGRRIFVSAPSVLPASFRWDRRSGSGRVPAGIYYARIRASAGSSRAVPVLVLP